MRLSIGEKIQEIGKRVGVLLTILFTAISPVFAGGKLPEPTGAYPVGTIKYEWTDESRLETFTKKTDDKRSLLVQVWYPTEKADGENQSGTVSVLPLAKAQPLYPVLIFSHGFGMTPEQYTLLMEELASHGYVIFSIAHPYEAGKVVYPDGRVVEISPEVIKSLKKSKKQKQANRLLEQYQTTVSPEVKDQILRQYDALAGEIVQNSLKIWVEDTFFSLEQIKKLNSGNAPNVFMKHLNLERLGIFGHSYGGTVAGKVCMLDNRFKAGVNMDGHQFGQFTDFQDRFLEQPFMIMHSQTPPGPGVNDFMFQKINNWAYRISIHDAKHLDFTDLPVYSHSIVKLMGQSGAIKPERMHQIVTGYLLAFFGKHLRGIDSPLLNGPGYPEVDFLVRDGGLSTET